MKTSTTNEIHALKKKVSELTNELVKLNEDDKLNQLILENTSDNIGITTFDLKAKYIYVSPSVKNILGFEPSDLIGKSFFDFIHPDDRLALFPVLKNYLKKFVGKLFNNKTYDESETIEFRFKNIDGEWRNMHSTVNIIGKNLLAITRDITDRIYNEQSIKQKAEELSIINSFSQLITSSLSLSEVLNKSIIGLQNAIKSDVAFLFIKDKNELKLHSVIPPNTKKRFDIIPDHFVGECLCGLAALNKTPVYSLNIMEDNRCTMPECKLSNIVSFTAIPLISRNEVIGVIGLGSDSKYDFESRIEFIETLSSQVSVALDNAKLYESLSLELIERKKMEADLLIAKNKAEESDRLKSAFLANTSHEIRTPMNGILGFASLLKTPELDIGKHTRYVKIIEKSGKRMLNIINDIIDISKVEAGQIDVKTSSFFLNELIEDLHLFFTKETNDAGLKLSTILGLNNADSNIVTDKEKLYAILTNLIKNSIKYTNTGSIEFGYLLVGDKLEFFVSDTGIGIPKERQQSVFERFVQADIEDKKTVEGSGLGLAITKAYVELLDGSIWLESEEGNGTKVIFSILYKKVTTVHDSRKNNLKPEIKSKFNILIAEDEEISKDLFLILLADISKKVLHAKTGVETIELCKTNPDLDIILMDIKMPIMDGYTAAKEIRKFNKKIVIIAQTAYARPNEKDIAIKSGCNDYITKPINKIELLTKIKESDREEFN